MRTSTRGWARIAAPLAGVALVSAFMSPAAVAATAATTGTCYDDPCVRGIRAVTHTGYDRLVFDLTSSTQISGTSTNTTGAYVPMSGQTEYLTVRSSGSPSVPRPATTSSA